MTKKIDDIITHFLIDFINEYEKARKDFLKTEIMIDSRPELKKIFNKFKQLILNLIIENMPTEIKFGKEFDKNNSCDNNYVYGFRRHKEICTQKIKELFKEE